MWNPNQPRDPAGSATGGQWTSGSLGDIAKRAQKTSSDLQAMGLEPSKIEKIPSQSNPGTNMQVHVNPGQNQMRAFMDKSLSAPTRGIPNGANAVIRSIRDGAGNKYFWSAADATHEHVANHMGISWKYAMPDSISYDQARGHLMAGTVPARGP